MLAGVRFSSYENEERDELVGASIFTAEQDWSPQLGLVYQPTDWLSLYGSYSRSFEVNSGTDSNGDRYLPTYGTQYEAGAKFTFNDNLFATIAFYDITRDNLLTPDPENTNISIQTSQTKSNGFEIDLSEQITPNWQILAAYSAIDARITQDNRFPIGNKLNRYAPNTFRLWTRYDFDGELQGWSVGGGVYSIGPVWANLTNTFQFPGYTTVDAFIGYRFSENLEAQLNISNLFDEEFYSGFGAFNVLPGDPRAAILNVRYNF